MRRAIPGYGNNACRPQRGPGTSSGRTRAPTITDHPLGRTGKPCTHQTERPRIVGWLFIGTFVFAIPGYPLYGPLLDDPDCVLGNGRDTQITLGAFLEILTAICNIGTAVALYPLARRYRHRLALGYVATRIVESTIIVAGIVSVLSVLTLRQQFSPTGADADTLTIAGQMLVAFHDWTFLLGPGFCAGIGNGLLLGYLMYASGLLPRRLAILGLVGGSLAFLAATGVLFDVYDRQSAPQILLTVPEMIWEITFGIYLVAKGFMSPATRQQVDRRRAATAVPALG
jgi:hypothetical protein